MNIIVLGAASLVAEPADGDDPLATIWPEAVRANRSRRSDESVVQYLRYVLACADSAERLVVLEGWETDPALAGAALILNSALDSSTFELVDGRARELSEADIVAALTPGAGVVAPDSDPDELPHEEAARIVLGPRGAFYDSPRRNFGRIGLIWSGLLGRKLRDGQLITARDVALMMVGVKLSRESFRHKRDNIVDGHGYLMTLQMILDEDESDAADA